MLKEQNEAKICCRRRNITFYLEYNNSYMLQLIKPHTRHIILHIRIYKYKYIKSGFRNISCNMVFQKMSTMRVFKEGIVSFSNVYHRDHSYFPLRFNVSEITLHGNEKTTKEGIYMVVSDTRYKPFWVRWIMHFAFHCLTSSL